MQEKKKGHLRRRHSKHYANNGVKDFFHNWWQKIIIKQKGSPNWIALMIVNLNHKFKKGYHSALSKGSNPIKQYVWMVADMFLKNVVLFLK